MLNEEQNHQKNNISSFNFIIGIMLFLTAIIFIIRLIRFDTADFLTAYDERILMYILFGKYNLFDAEISLPLVIISNISYTIGFLFLYFPVNRVGSAFSEEIKDGKVFPLLLILFVFTNILQHTVELKMITFHPLLLLFLFSIFSFIRIKVLFKSYRILALPVKKYGTFLLFLYAITYAIFYCLGFTLISLGLRENQPNSLDLGVTMLIIYAYLEVVFLLFIGIKFFYDSIYKPTIVLETKLTRNY
ncbi:MAG: hypothetical protein ACTSRR_11940 [Candidatus Heimdallarchaeaceae archaeon]|uniref:Uncharacterized protein n=1 Tax=Candidatus Heimdallarchaeum endolithica TaxID=2876572 RepID=A0A9Y1BPJ6_9ARCH|nr:MAG: hypothetical protein K9W46_10645 [Candidatus Heimdallarchaeum endolithica]